MDERRLCKLWKVGGSKDKCLDPKCKAQHSIYTDKRNAEKEKFANVKDNKENNFHDAKQMRRENQDIIREKCIQDDDRNFSLDDASRTQAWKHRYE